MDPIRKYIIQQIIKQTGKIPRATSLIDNAVAQLKIRLKNAGQDISKITDPKQITHFFNKEKSLLNQQIKQTTEAAPKNILKTTKEKAKPFTGWTPKVIKGSMRPGDYFALKKEYFRRVMTSTDDSINNFLKKGIDKADDRFLNLSKTQRKDFLDMVQYRLKHGNKKFMNDFTDAAGKFKFPENLAGGGIAGLLGEPIYEDDNHRVPYEGGGVGLPPVSFYFDMQGGAGKKAENFLGIEGLTKKGYDYGGTFGADTTFPFLGGELSVGGELGFGRDKSNVDYKGQPIDWLSNVGETKLGDDWNVGFKWSKKFNKGGRVPLKKGKTPWKAPSADENILEGIWKNMGPWEKVLWGLGLSPFEKGGRVDLAGGGLAAALRLIMQKYGKDAIKLAKDVKPSKKWDTQKAIQAFKDRNPEFKAEGGVARMLGE